MEYIEYTQKYDKQLIELWNQELFFDAINLEIFQQKALFDDNFDSQLCMMAIDNNKLVGFIMATKRKFPYLERGLEPERAWINVMFVDKKYQNQGIGEKLYKEIEEKLKQKGTKEITLAAYSPNYFFGGVDVVNYPIAKSFFEKMGFENKGMHYSMGRDLHGFHLSDNMVEKYNNLLKKGYRFVEFEYSYSLELLDFLKKEFGGGWKRNALIAMQKRTAPDVIILVLDPEGKICGFSMSAIDGNPMRFGPIGISENRRNEGIGSVLLNYSLYHMAKRGIYRMYFMTTDEPGKRYYERNGLSVIRTLCEYRKKL